MTDWGPLGGLASGDAHCGTHVAGAVAAKWSALHDAAGVVAALAGVASEPEPDDVRNFQARLDASGGWRRTLAETAVDDLAAVMEPGIAALLAVHGRGTPPAAAAQALWHEFVRARAAITALVDADD